MLSWEAAVAEDWLGKWAKNHHSNQSRLGAVSVAGKRNFEARDKGAETAVGIHLGARRDQASSTPCATPNCRPRASRTSGATDAVSLVFRGALADKKGVRRNKTAVNTGRGRLLAGVSLQMRQQRVERPKADPFIPDRACFSVLTRGPQRARELLTIRSRTSCRPKTMTTSIGSKSAAEPHDRAAKESQLQREVYLMAARQERIDAFIHEGSPPADQPLEILCEDHVGTYVIPFLCQWTEGTWQNAKTRRRIEAAVIGWRDPKRNQR